MSVPYRLDRSSDGQFVRAQDFQRNCPPIEGQVVATHGFYGHPPYMSYEQYSAGDSWSGPGYGYPTGVADEWLQGFDDWMNDGIPFDNEPDVDNEAYITGAPRYLTVTLLGTGGYEHTITVHQHTGATIYEKLTAYLSSASGNATYTYQLSDDGTVVTTGVSPASETYGTPNETASYAQFGSTSWPTAIGYLETSGSRSCTVGPNTITFISQVTATDQIDGGGPQTANFDYTYTLSNGYGLGSLESDLAVLLDMVNLACPSQLYPIEGDTTRALYATGESVTVYYDGPSPPTGATLNPLRVVFSSNGGWNWASDGPCVVAQNLNDAVAHTAGFSDTGVDPATGEGDVTIGGGFQMMKAQALIPPGGFNRQVEYYVVYGSAALLIPDNQTWAARYGSPETFSVNFDRGGENSGAPSIDPFVGTGTICSFSPDAFITTTRVDPA